MRKILLIIFGLVIIAGNAAIAAAYLRNNNKNVTNNAKPATNKTSPSYQLNLVSGNKYAVAEPTSLQFDIKNQNGKAKKDFDTVHEKTMHLIVVRKDRTNFQHVHPTMDKSSGRFQLNDFSFPSEGEYRIFADFTAADSAKTAGGDKPPTTIFQDVVAGDINKYQPAILAADKFNSSANGLDSEVFEAGNDGGASGYTAGTSNSIAISISKGGQPFKQLERYLGALGHMVVLGPDLEFVHAHAQSDDVENQSGVMSFGVNFPKPGRYAAFLQTQSGGMISTFDYALTAAGTPDSSGAKQSAPSPAHADSHQ